MNSISIAVLGLALIADHLHAQQGVTKPVIVPKRSSSTTVATPLETGSVPSPAALASNAATYVLGSDDVIMINVWKEPNLSGLLTVRPDGAISIPLLGDIRAAGSTPMMLATTISDQLKKYITEPSVTVTVTAVNSKHVFLLGEVAHIGPLALMPGMDILQAIASAGGLTPFANAKHIYILRGPQGKQERIPFDYKKAVKQGDQQGVTLLPGDTIYIP